MDTQKGGDSVAKRSQYTPPLPSRPLKTPSLAIASQQVSFSALRSLFCTNRRKSRASFAKAALIERSAMDTVDSP